MKCLRPPDDAILRRRIRAAMRLTSDASVVNTGVMIEQLLAAAQPVGE